MNAYTLLLLISLMRMLPIVVLQAEWQQFVKSKSLKDAAWKYWHYSD